MTEVISLRVIDLPKRVLDKQKATPLWVDVDAAIKAGVTRIELDFTNVSDIQSGVVSVLAGWQNIARRNESLLVLTKVNTSTQDSLKLFGADTIFRIIS